MAQCLVSARVHESSKMTSTILDHDFKHGFFDFPRELRDQIYEHLLATRYKVSIARALRLPSSHLAILRTCHTINEEALPIFYRKAFFWFYSHRDSPVMPYNLSQETADQLQNISITYQIGRVKPGNSKLWEAVLYDKATQTLVPGILSKFTNPNVKRKTCSITVHWSPEYDNRALHAFLNATERLIAFMTITVDVNVMGSFLSGQPFHPKLAVRILRGELETRLGPAMTCPKLRPRQIVFKPQAYRQAMSSNSKAAPNLN